MAKYICNVCTPPCNLDTGNRYKSFVSVDYPNKMCECADWREVDREKCEGHVANAKLDQIFELLKSWEPAK